MGFRRFGLKIADKEIKVHSQVIHMIFLMIQRAKNDRSVQRALLVYDNWLVQVLSYQYYIVHLYILISVRQQVKCIRLLCNLDLN